MEVIKTPIDGVLIIEPKVFGDKRGYFLSRFLSVNLMRRLLLFLDTLSTSFKTMKA